MLAGGTRLLTLTGPGGSGKTRLAIEAAAELVPEFKSGVFWVSLAALRDPVLVSEEIAQTLGAKEELAAHIGECEMLLLLDNFEQVVQAAPELSGLLERCPHLTLLVTSRELLRVRGEVDYPLPPLAERDAIELFCARAQLEPDETIGELCRQLEELPLALELAAARTRVLPPAQILERLSQRLDLLEGGRDTDPRQQTLRATLEWSHELLGDEERQLFARLSVFAGGCTLAAAEEVVGADIDGLQSLIEKSLLRRTGGRFWMLETIREYALERLDQAGEGSDTRRRHADWYWELLRLIDPETDAVIEIGREQLDRFDAEVANTWAALETLLAEEPRDALRFSIELAPYWQWRSRLRDGCAWLRRALANDLAPSVERARALSALGLMSITLGELDEAGRALDEAIATARTLGAQTALGRALSVRAFLALNRSEYQQAVNDGREALTTAEGSGTLDNIHHAGEILGLALAGIGEYDEALALLESSLDSSTVQHQAVIRVNLGWVNLQLGNYTAAESHLDRALRTFEELGMGLATAIALAHLALIDLAEERFEIAIEKFLRALDGAVEGESDEWTLKAVSSIGAAARHRDPEAAVRVLAAGTKRVAELGNPADPPFAQEFNRALDELRIILGEERLQDLLHEGRALLADETIAQARVLAQGSPAPRSADHP
jgi:predicted ATPase/Tfp pilus assembly protein PilF